MTSSAVTRGSLFCVDLSRSTARESWLFAVPTEQSRHSAICATDMSSTYRSTTAARCLGEARPTWPAATPPAPLPPAPCPRHCGQRPWRAGPQSAGAAGVEMEAYERGAGVRPQVAAAVDMPPAQPHPYEALLRQLPGIVRVPGECVPEAHQPRQLGVDELLEPVTAEAGQCSPPFPSSTPEGPERLHGSRSDRVTRLRRRPGREAGHQEEGRRGRG